MSKRKTYRKYVTKDALTGEKVISYEDCND